jgi:hypothetical protein
MGIAPMRKKIVVSGIYIDLIARGKIVEAWIYWDHLRFFQQLGVVSLPGKIGS